jgi:hypothetical protein
MFGLRKSRLRVTFPGVYFIWYDFQSMDFKKKKNVCFLLLYGFMRLLSIYVWFIIINDDLVFGQVHLMSSDIWKIEFKWLW